MRQFFMRHKYAFTIELFSTVTLLPTVQFYVGIVLCARCNCREYMKSFSHNFLESKWAGEAHLLLPGDVTKHSVYIYTAWYFCSFWNNIKFTMYRHAGQCT